MSQLWQICATLVQLAFCSSSLGVFVCIIKGPHNTIYNRRHWVLGGHGQPYSVMGSISSVFYLTPHLVCGIMLVMMKYLKACPLCHKLMRVHQGRFLVKCFCIPCKKTCYRFWPVIPDRWARTALSIMLVIGMFLYHKCSM